MGYDGYDENETEYIPEAGIVLQDDDRVSNNQEITKLSLKISFFSFFPVCPAFTQYELTAPIFTSKPNQCLIWTKTCAKGPKKLTFGWATFSDKRLT